MAQVRHRPRDARGKRASAVPIFLQPCAGDGSSSFQHRPRPSFDPLSRARSAHAPLPHPSPRRSVALRTGRQPVSAGGVTGVSLERARRAPPRAQYSKKPLKRGGREDIFRSSLSPSPDLRSLPFHAFRVTPRR